MLRGLRAAGRSRAPCFFEGYVARAVVRDELGQVVDGRVVVPPARLEDDLGFASEGES